MTSAGYPTPGPNGQHTAEDEPADARGAGADPAASVLVVDDDPKMREVAVWALEDEGFAVDAAADRRQAAEQVRRRRPSLVVLDMGLPPDSGDAVAADLRAACGAALPILVITADGRASEKARRVGAFAYLHKPFDLEQLVRLVRDGLAA
jgi:DNA-binding response OmpR family regulator